MTPYEHCITQAAVIGQKFHDLIANNNTKQQKFFIEYPDVQKFNIRSPILVLGLNPAGEDNPEIGRRSPNLLFHIPEIENTISAEDYQSLQKFCYSPYFKTFIDCFRKLKPSINPFWFHKDVLDEIIKENSKYITEEDIRPLRCLIAREQNNTNYLIFADLVQYSMTDSKVILKYLKVDGIPMLVNQYFESLIAFTKPKLIVSANAAVSHYLIENFNDNKDAASFDYKEIRIFLASMLTGQRAMDVFSRIRLFNEIQDYLNIKSA